MHSCLMLTQPGTCSHLDGTFIDRMEVRKEHTYTVEVQRSGTPGGLDVTWTAGVLGASDNI